MMEKSKRDYGYCREKVSPAESTFNIRLAQVPSEAAALNDDIINSSNVEAAG
jgi:hypothetical protein